MYWPSFKGEGQRSTNVLAKHDDDTPLSSAIGEASVINEILPQIGRPDRATKGGTIHFNRPFKVHSPRLCHLHFPQLVHEHKRLSGAFAAPLGPRSPSTVLYIQGARMLDSGELL